MTAKPPVQYQWQRLDDMSARQVHALIQRREAVFVVEQACAYLEADDLDIASWHLTAHCGDDIIGYLRVLDPGQKYPEPSIGHVLTAAAHRCTGVGRALVAEGICRARATFPGAAIRISAQQYLTGFYQSFGFQPVGARYLEDDIEHVEMWLAGGP